MMEYSLSQDDERKSSSPDFVVVDEINEDIHDESFNWNDMLVIDEDMGDSSSNANNLSGQSSVHQASASHAQSPAQVGGGYGNEESELEVIDEDDFHPTFRQHSLLGLLQDTELQTHGPKTDLLIYLRNLTNHIEVQIKKALEKKKGIKFWISLKVSYVHPAKPHQQPLVFYLHTGKLLLVNEFQLPDTLEEIRSKILQRNAHFLKEQSGLVFEKIHSARFKVAEYLPLAGKSYAELPRFLANKKAIVNVNNDDNRCFGYALLSCFLSSQQYMAHRPGYYDKYFQQYGLADLSYPIGPSEIPSIEDQLEICINIFSFYDDEGRARYPIYVSKKNFQKTIDLLYWDEHYAWIKSFCRFMAGISKNGHRLLWCRRCLCHFSTQNAFETHQLYCKRIDFSDQIYTMPPEGSKLKFKHYRCVHIFSIC